MEKDKWQRSKGKPFKPAHEPVSGVPAAKEVIPPGYEEYLLLLQQRNRLLKRLKEKDEQQIEIEKKEQGFSIYVNGANTGIVGPPVTASPKSRCTSRQTKTADTYSERKRVLQQELQYLEREAGELRVKTAPDQTVSAARKGWDPGALQIKTEKGPRVKIRAPGKLSGKYSEDFESLAIEDDDEDDGSDNDDDDYLVASGNMSSDDEDEEPDELTLSFNDVETLRKSLEADQSIRQSIEAAKMRIQYEKEAGESGSEEEEDEIEEELELAKESLNLHDSYNIENLPQLRPIGAAATTSTAPSNSKCGRENDISISQEDSSSFIKEEKKGRKSSSTKRKDSDSIPITMSQEGLSMNSVKEAKKDNDSIVTGPVVMPGADPTVMSPGTVLREKTFVKESGKKKEKHPYGPDEDLIVLSFSSTAKKKKERVLSASRRKQGAEDVILTKENPIPFIDNPKSCNGTTTLVSNPHSSTQATQELKSVPSSKRSRPLSATRRTSPNMVTKPEDNVDEVLKAMQEENKEIESVKSRFHTAPEKSQRKPLASPMSARPQSIGPCETDMTIDMVTEKVRNMDPRQQQQLISLLSKLELKEPPYKMSSPTPSPRGSPIKATVPFGQIGDGSPTAIERSITPIQFQTSSFSYDPESAPEEGIDVNIEINSNWGHPDTLGITEIQFFDLEGRQIVYDESNISLSGHVGEKGKLGNLANGKTKTNKSRYMWSCHFTAGHPVELIIRLPVSASEGTVSRIVFWNYNRGVKYLNIGVKDLRLFIGGVLVWKGTIDKGCGNQVFDYSKEVNLVDSEQKQQEPDKFDAGEATLPLRSETVTLKRGSLDPPEPTSDKSASVGLPVKQEQPSVISPTTKQFSLPSSPRPSKEPTIPHSPHASQHLESTATRPQSPRRSKTRGKGNLLDSLLQSKDIRDEVDGKITRSSSTPNLSSSSDLEKDETANSPRGDSFALPSKPPWLTSSKGKGQLRSRSSSRSRSRPIWLDENKEGDKEGARSFSSNDALPPRDPTPDSARLPWLSPRSTGRSHSLPGEGDERWPSDFAARQGSQELRTELDETSSKATSDTRSSRRRDTPSPALVEAPRPSSRDPDLSSSAGARSKRQEWKQNQSLSLEESWNVLSLFEKCHKGRITKDLDLQLQDDALDEILPRSATRKDQSVPPKDSTTADPPAASDDSRLIDLEIPTLPLGKKLVINLKSTWGDRHYVGLNGIEVFTDEGRPAEIADILADPPDINVLPEYGNDPRVVTNLIDGVYRTRDDMHLWLAPFTARSNHYITITFIRPVRIAMIRIWNYNKSRIHSYRGARDVEFSLDGSLIFQGEIARASGTLGADEPFGDTMLFTMDEAILDAMAQNDPTYEIPKEEDLLGGEGDRPSTADREEGPCSQDKGERPFTCARQRKQKQAEHEEVDAFIEQDADSDDEADICNGYYTGQVVQLNFASTWGDPYYLGLTGLELLTPQMVPIPLNIDMLQANPRDLNDLPDYGDDDRTLDKIVDGTNVTTSDEHMWLIPFTDGEDHTLTIDLGLKTELLGMRVWNYNKSLDGTFRGAKIVHVSLDGKLISPPEGYLLRKGPGNVHFDFAQDVYFSGRNSTGGSSTSPLASVPETRRSQSRVNIRKLIPDYEPALMPTGFVFQFQLLSSWGDPYYVGLNGIEFYDSEGYRIRLRASDVTAYPHSVNVLDGVTDDVRTPDKLVDGVNDTMDGKHMWLAPTFPGQINLIYVIFDEPKTVSMIKMWNYSKTPIRGAHQFGILVDDLLVYHGFLPQVPRTGCRGILPNLDMPVPHHTVLFTDSPENVAISERGNLVKQTELEQDVQLTNDNTVVTRYTTPTPAKAADPALRPKTSVKAFSKRHR
ncbi:katanin-interacting protein [Nematostella vectensis]|uniref:katanin-interacting protein n=1 Tax=Nematostella vectensis TaxID=45351 RepID=UPI00207761D6|nr:katanin-interacting protein [Nematostella vectensis]